MKKRRELDALVKLNGKLGRNKKKKGQHELLRNSESSDVEEFAIPTKPIRLRKHNRSSRLCATCMSVCGCFLLLACVIAIVGLIWVHLELKKDVDFLRSQLQKVESGSAGNPDEFQDLHKKQQELEDSINRITSGKNGIEVQAANISHIFQQLKTLEQTTNGHSESLKAASKLEGLPDRVDKLTEQVAEFGSQIRTLENSIKTLETFKTNTEKELADLQASKTEDDSSPREGADIPAEILQIHETLNSLTNRVDTVNDTASKKYLAVKEQVDIHSRELGRLNTTLLDVAAQLQQLQPLPSTSSSEVTEIEAQIKQLISSAIEKLQQTTATKEELQVLQNQVLNISSGLETISGQHDNLTATSSQVTTADLEALRGDMERCCKKCTETMKSFNSSFEDLKSKVSSLQSTDEDENKDESEVERDFVQKRPDPDEWEKFQSDSEEQEQVDQDFSTTTTTTTTHLPDTTTTYLPNESQASEHEKDADGYDSSEYEDDNSQDGNPDYQSDYGYNYDGVTDGYKDKYDAFSIKEDLPDEHDEVERERNNFGTRRAAIPDLPGEEDGGGYERGDDVMKSLRDFIRGNH